MAISLASHEDAARIAGRVLTAWRAGKQVDHYDQLRRVRDHTLDTCELERLDALEGALVCLRDFPHARVHAAITVLEHLAQPQTIVVRQ